MRGIHRWPVVSPHKGVVTREMFPCRDPSMVNNLSGAYHRKHQSYILQVFFAVNPLNQWILHTEGLAIQELPIICWPINVETTFQNAFVFKESFEFGFIFFLKFVPGCLVYNKPVLVEIMAWHRTSHYLNQCWLDLLPYIFVTRSQSLILPLYISVINIICLSDYICD